MENNIKFKELLALGLEAGSLWNKKRVHVFSFVRNLAWVLVLKVS